MEVLQNKNQPPLFEEIRTKLERAVRSVCPDWMMAQQDDLVQVCLLKVLDVLKKSGGNHELASSYLWKVAHNAMIDEIRRQRRRHEVSLTPEEGEGDMELPETSGGPEQAFQARRIGLGIQACLGALMDSRRLVVTLNLQGHSVPDSARILGWTLKKVENLVYRGLQELRDCLTRKGLRP